MITEDKFYGGALETSITGDIYVHINMGRVQVLDLTAVDGFAIGQEWGRSVWGGWGNVWGSHWRMGGASAAAKAKLPDTTDLKPGGPYFYIINEGVADVILANHDGTALSPSITLSQNEVATICLGLDGSTKIWLGIIEDVTGATPPTEIKYVYVFGGDGSKAETSRIQEFNVNTNTWTWMTSSNHSHEYGTGWYIGNRGYAYDSLHLDDQYVLEEYYGTTWTDKTSGDIGTTQSTQILGKGYLVETAGTRRVREYDRISDAWTSKANSTPATVGTWGGIASKAYGSFGTLSSLDTYEYDPLTDVWTDKSVLAPSPSRSFMSGEATDTKFYSCCGIGVGTIDDVDEYDPSGNSWASKADYPPGDRTKGNCTVANNKVYYQMGFYTVNQDDCQELNPVTNSWTAKQDTLWATLQVEWSSFPLIP